MDKAELHITTNNGTEIITFSNAALSFYLGTQHPFTKVAMTSEDEGNYIVLPWNLGSQAGRDNLKNLINRIPSNIRELKYIIYVKDYENLSSLSLESSKDLSQIITSLASLHLSDIAAEDETENLVNKIDDLEKQIEDLQNKLYIRLQADRNQNWTVALPKISLSAGSNIAANMNFSGSMIIATGVMNHAIIDNVVGNVTLDLINKKLIIGGNSCGRVNVA